MDVGLLTSVLKNTKVVEMLPQSAGIQISLKSDDTTSIQFTCYVASNEHAYSTWKSF